MKRGLVYGLHPVVNLLTLRAAMGYTEYCEISQRFGIELFYDLLGRIEKLIDQ